MECEKLVINGHEYIRSDCMIAATNTEGKLFVIIRSYAAGVFAGYLASKKVEGSIVTVILDRCIRLWRWTGATLSQVATDGVAGTGENKFAGETNGHEIENVIEIIPCTEKAMRAIQAVKKWKM